MPYTRPSFYALNATGILILSSLVIIAMGFKAFDTYQLLTSVLLLTIAIGIHGLLHAQLEPVYNPLASAIKYLHQ